jgi:hypothetical protein
MFPPFQTTGASVATVRARDKQDPKTAGEIGTDLAGLLLLREKSMGRSMCASAADPVLLYGFPEGTCTTVLDEAYLRDHFPGVVTAASGLEPVYGVPASIGGCGQLQVDPDSKKAVDDLFSQFQDYHVRAPLACSDKNANGVELAGPRSPHFLLGLTGRGAISNAACGCHAYRLDDGYSSFGDSD